MANYYTRFSFMVEGVSEVERTWLAQRLEESEEVNFGWAFDSDGLWLHDGDQGDVEQVAEFVHDFIGSCRPTAVFSFTWAATCDKPLVDAFDGGAAVITATDIEWMSGSAWASQRMRITAVLPANE